MRHGVNTVTMAGGLGVQSEEQKDGGSHLDIGLDACTGQLANSGSLMPEHMGCSLMMEKLDVRTAQWLVDACPGADALVQSTDERPLRSNPLPP